MKSFLRVILGGTLLFAATAGSAWAADSGARTKGAYSNGDTPGTAIADTVTTNVRAQLESDRLLRGSTITVNTSEQGVVTLVGSIPNVTASQRAAEIARETPGVVSVTNMLRLLVTSPQAPSQD